MSRPLRCTERCCDRCPAENSMAGKYLSARSISVAAGLGFPKPRLGPRRRNAQRVATSLTRRSNLSVTFGDRKGNAQRGIGPLHRTGMFPGSATPEEWITLVFYRKRAFETECVWRLCSGALSIKPLEGSRLRLRRRRGLSMGFQSIFALKALPEAGFGKKAVIDAHRF